MARSLLGIRGTRTPYQTQTSRPVLQAGAFLLLGTYSLQWPPAKIPIIRNLVGRRHFRFTDVFPRGAEDAALRFPRSSLNRPGFPAPFAATELCEARRGFRPGPSRKWLQNQICLIHCSRIGFWLGEGGSRSPSLDTDPNVEHVDNLSVSRHRFIHRNTNSSFST